MSRIRNTFFSVLGAALMCGAVGCAADGGDDSSAVDITGGPQDGGPNTGTCVAGDVDTGVPDLMGTPTFSPSAVNPGDTVTVSVPVDSDTGYVTVAVFRSDRTLFAGGAHAITEGSETVELSFVADGGPGAALTEGEYFAIVNVCVDETACLEELTGTAYAPENGVVEGGRYHRIEYEGDSDGSYDQSCYDVEFLTVE